MKLEYLSKNSSKIVKESDLSKYLASGMSIGYVLVIMTEQIIRQGLGINLDKFVS